MTSLPIIKGKVLVFPKLSYPFYAYNFWLAIPYTSMQSREKWVPMLGLFASKTWSLSAPSYTGKHLGAQVMTLCWEWNSVRVHSLQDVIDHIS